MSKKKQITLLHKIKALHKLIEQRIKLELDDWRFGTGLDDEDNMDKLKVYCREVIVILNEYYRTTYDDDFGDFLPFGLTYQYKDRKMALDLKPEEVFVHAFNEELLEKYKQELFRVVYCSSNEQEHPKYDENLVTVTEEEELAIDREERKRRWNCTHEDKKKFLEERKKAIFESFNYATKSELKRIENKGCVFYPDVREALIEFTRRDD